MFEVTHLVCFIASDGVCVMFLTSFMLLQIIEKLFVGYELPERKESVVGLRSGFFISTCVPFHFTPAQPHTNELWCVSLFLFTAFTAFIMRATAHSSLFKHVH